MMIVERETWSQRLERIRHKRVKEQLEASVERVLAWGTDYKQRYETERLKVGSLIAACALLLTAFVVVVWNGAWLLMVAGSLAFGYFCHRNGHQLGVLDGELQAAKRQREAVEQAASPMARLLRNDAARS